MTSLSFPLDLIELEFMLRDGPPSRYQSVVDQVFAPTVPSFAISLALHFKSIDLGKVLLLNSIELTISSFNKF